MCVGATGASGGELLGDKEVEAILKALPLCEAVRIAVTCKTYKRVFKRLMGEQQKARWELALRTFGNQRIACILSLIVDVLNGRLSNLVFVPDKSNYFWITVDGVLQGPSASPSSSPYKSQTGDVCISIELSGGVIKYIEVMAKHWPAPRLAIHIPPECGFATMSVVPLHDEDFEPVALAQALLHKGLAQILRASNRFGDVCVRQFLAPGVITREGLIVQIAPLVPLGSGYRHEEVMPGSCRTVKEVVQMNY
jgi:hypothetical protein